MKRTWRNRIAAVIPVVLLSVASVAAELPNEEKLAVIDRIISEKMQESKGGDVLAAVLDAVSQQFPLDAQDTPESDAIIKQQKEKARRKFPSTDKQLTVQFTPAAEAEYPIYKLKSTVKVVYELAGKPFPVTGTYYRSDSKHVWVGSKKILRYQISPEYAYRFNPDQAQALRRKFILKKIAEYHHAAEAYELQLLMEQSDNIERLRKKVKFKGRWHTVRNVVEQKYAAESARRDNQIASKIQRAKDCRTYEETFEILESVLQDNPNHPLAGEARKLLEFYKSKATAQLIEKKIELAQKTPTYKEKFAILEEIIARYPDHEMLPQVTNLLNKYKGDYSRKSEEVKQILAYCSPAEINPRQLNAQFGINIYDPDLMSTIESLYFDIPGLEKLKEVLDNHQKIQVANLKAKLQTEGINVRVRLAKGLNFDADQWKYHAAYRFFADGQCVYEDKTKSINFYFDLHNVKLGTKITGTVTSIQATYDLITPLDTLVQEAQIYDFSKYMKNGYLELIFWIPKID